MKVAGYSISNTWSLRSLHRDTDRGTVHGSCNTVKLCALKGSIYSNTLVLIARQRPATRVNEWLPIITACTSLLVTEVAPNHYSMHITVSDRGGSQSLQHAQHC